MLKDSEKRRIYDDYGEDALKEGMGNGGGHASSMADLFDMMSGGGGGGRRRGPEKGEPIVHKLKSSLREMYNGATRKLALLTEHEAKELAELRLLLGRSPRVPQAFTAAHQDHASAVPSIHS